MRIVIEVSPEELKEMDVTVDLLKEHIIYDLDCNRDYSGYNVDVVCVDPSSSKLTLSRVTDHLRVFGEL